MPDCHFVSPYQGGLTSTTPKKRKFFLGVGYEVTAFNGERCW